MEFANRGEGAMAVTGVVSIGKDIKLIDVVSRYNRVCIDNAVKQLVVKTLKQNYKH